MRVLYLIKAVRCRAFRFAMVVVRSRKFCGSAFDAPSADKVASRHIFVSFVSRSKRDADACARSCAACIRGSLCAAVQSPVVMVQDMQALLRPHVFFHGKRRQFGLASTSGQLTHQIIFGCVQT